MSIPLTLHLPPHPAAAIEGAVTRGAYPSPEALVEAALAEWQSRGADLRVALAEGVEDMQAGRTKPFDLERILAEGMRGSSPSV